MSGDKNTKDLLGWLKKDQDAIKKAQEKRDVRLWDAINGIEKRLREQPSHETPCESLESHFKIHQRISDRRWQVLLKFMLPAASIGFGCGAIFFN